VQRQGLGRDPRDLQLSTFQRMGNAPPAGSARLPVIITADAAHQRPSVTTRVPNDSPRRNYEKNRSRGRILQEAPGLLFSLPERCGGKMPERTYCSTMQVENCPNRCSGDKQALPSPSSIGCAVGRAAKAISGVMAADFDAAYLTWEGILQQYAVCGDGHFNQRFGTQSLQEKWAWAQSVASNSGQDVRETQRSLGVRGS